MLLPGVLLWGGRGVLLRRHFLIGEIVSPVVRPSSSWFLPSPNHVSLSTSKTLRFDLHWTVVSVHSTRRNGASLQTSDWAEGQYPGCPPCHRHNLGVWTEHPHGSGDPAYDEFRGGSRPR